jgi:hypothetical protein
MALDPGNPEVYPRAESRVAMQAGVFLRDSGRFSAARARAPLAG